MVEEAWYVVLATGISWDDYWERTDDELAQLSRAARRLERDRKKQRKRKG